MTVDPAVVRLFTLPFRALTIDELNRISALTGEEIRAHAEAADRLPDLAALVNDLRHQHRKTPQRWN